MILSLRALIACARYSRSSVRLTTPTVQAIGSECECIRLRRRVTRYSPNVEAALRAARLGCRGTLPWMGADSTGIKFLCSLNGFLRFSYSAWVISILLQIASYLAITCDSQADYWIGRRQTIIGAACSRSRKPSTDSPVKGSHSGGSLYDLPAEVYLPRRP